MIKFDIKRVSFKTVHVKSLTTALGGAITIIDAERSVMTGKEVYTRIAVPMQIVRQFQVKHKTSHYLKPVVSSIAYYDGHVIAMERHPLGALGRATSGGLVDGEEYVWTSDMESNMTKLIAPLVQTGEWFFDGKFIYHFDRPAQQCVTEGEFMTKDGKFRSIEVSAIQLSDLDDRTKLSPAIRTCLAFVATNGKFAITPPIWKTLSSVGNDALTKATTVEGAIRGEETDEDRRFQFDAIDNHLSVNLAFALKAGAEVGALFGYEAMDPLQLPELMIRLKTVNLPNVPSQVKQTFDIGMKFTHAIAWLMGLSTRVDTLDSYIVLRSILKYLTTKGIFRANMFDVNHVFKTGFDIETIPYVGIDQAKEYAGNLTVDELIKSIRSGANKRKQKTTESTVVGGLYGAE